MLCSARVVCNLAVYRLLGLAVCTFLILLAADWPPVPEPTVDVSTSIWAATLTTS